MADSKIVETPQNFFRVQQVVRKILIFPRWQDAALAALSAVLLVLAFPDFELWFLAWFGLVPLLIAVERNKDSSVKSFWLGLLNGFVFFTGTCWWLTNAPIQYGGIPAPIAYLLLFPATIGAGVFTGIFAAILARLLSKFGQFAVLLAPFVWTACEFARLQITGNAWNALGYSQAFNVFVLDTARYGGVFLTSFLLVAFNSFFVNTLAQLPFKKRSKLYYLNAFSLACWFYGFVLVSFILNSYYVPKYTPPENPSAVVVALQPNVPMNGLTVANLRKLRAQHVELAETALREVESDEKLKNLPKIVVFPESPMNFEYAQDSEFREFLQEFNRRNRVSLLFNAGEPSLTGDGYHNSAVMTNERGERVAQYDKIRLVPFGEFVPEWLPGNELLPTVVGRMKPGKDFRLMPFGNVRAGTMICFESAFGDIAAGFVRNGADVLVELTNDGYSGNTPILRQHLANAVFRAVETNRPVLRVTNVGVTARISERGEISDALPVYTTGTRVWTVAKSDGEETFYVKYGDLFAWVCTILSLLFLGITFIKRSVPPA